MNTIDTSQFYGTEAYHKVSHLPYVLTDGAKYIADKAGAYWLMDAIASHVLITPAIWESQFAVATLDVDRKDNTATLTIDDGDGRVLARQEIEYTDYPEDQRQLYLCYQPGGTEFDWVLMLPSEY